MSKLGSVKFGEQEFDLDDLELGELEELEEYTGKSLDEVNWSSAKVMVFVAFLVRRREVPGFTLDDARQIKVIEVLPGDEEEAAGPPDLAVAASDAAAAAS
jgi:hypothetical protein